MGAITKIELYQKSQQVIKVFKENNISLDKVFAYGWICNRSTGTSGLVALNLLIKEDLNTEQLGELQKSLTNVFRQPVDIVTSASLEEKTEEILELHFKLQTAKIAKIDEEKVAISHLIQEGKEQLHEAMQIETQINQAKFALDLNFSNLAVSDLTTIQIETLIKLGRLQQDFSEQIELGNHSFNYLLKKNPDLSPLLDYAKQWSIHIACINNKLDIVKAIFAVDKSVLTLQDKRFGNTPLHVALMNDASDVVSFLLKQSADIHIANKKGLTPKTLADTKGVDLTSIKSTSETEEKHSISSELTPKLAI